MLKARFISIWFILLLLSSVTLSSQINQSYTEFGPIPNWVKSYPFPEVRKPYNLDLILLHNEHQSNFESEEVFYRTIYYVNTPKGIGKIESFNIDYEPEFQHILIHELSIHRNGKIYRPKQRPLIKNTYTTEQIGEDLYDDYARLTLLINEVKAGDLVEISYTKVGAQPDFLGVDNLFKYLVSEKQLGKNYTRVIAEKGKKINYKLMNVKKGEYKN